MKRFDLPLIGLAIVTVCLTGSGCTTHTSNASATVTSNPSSELRVVLPIEPTDLDPARVPDVTTSAIVQNTFEGLTRFNDKNQVEPALASAWDVSADGKSYTFHLRKGVKFHNGREFTASDVKYSFERALNKTTASAQAANYLDGIIGLKDVSDGKSSDLKGVTVLDPLTVKIDIDKPRAYFTGMLTMPQDFIVCREAVESTGGRVTDKSYVGTGAYKFDSYQPGRQITLAANPEYWDGAPKCPRIVMEVILNAQTAYDNFKTNKVDVSPDMDVLQYSQDLAHNAMRAEYRLTPEASINYVGLEEVKQPAFQKKEVRQAIGLAIDREEILRVAFKGVGSVATGILPEGMPMAGALPPQFHRDVAKAQALLAKAGYPNGKGFPNLTLSYIQQIPHWESEATVIRSNLHDALGIDVTLSAREAGDFYTAEQNHKLEMWVGGWVADYLDPQDFLSTLFVSGRQLNFFDYKNPEFDALCNTADEELNSDKRAELYSKAHAIAIDDMAVVPLHFVSRVTLVHTNVKGVRDCALYMLPYNLAIKN